MTERTDVLLYGMNFAPEMTGIGRYSGELGYGLAQNGKRVDVITTPPHYPGWYARAGYSSQRFQRETVAGVTILRCPILLHKAGAGIWRLIAPLSFAISSAAPVLWAILRGKPKAVLCVEPTLFAAPAALLAAKLVGATTVLHVQDLEVDAAFAVGHLANLKWLAALGQAFERFILRRFDVVVTISNEMAKRIEAKGGAPTRVHVIRNWVDTSRIFPLGRPSRYRNDLNLPDNTFVVLYSGQIGPKQALQVVFEAAERLERTRPDICFVIAGDGPLKARFQEKYGKLQNVRLLPLQPEDSLNEFLNLAGCHILPQHPAIKDLVLPSKLGGMLASGKDILVIADDDSELASFLGDSCDRLPTDKINDLAAAIVELPNQNRDAQVAKAEKRLALARSLGIDAAIKTFEALLAPQLNDVTEDRPQSKPRGASN
jgi:colanic acid biosynthesis glycosyl transferase WcaI